MKKKLIKFVECRTVPGLQFYDTPGVETHWNKYEIREPSHKIKDYDAWHKAIEEKVETNKELYRVTDWNE